MKSRQFSIQRTRKIDLPVMAILTTTLVVFLNIWVICSAALADDVPSTGQPAEQAQPPASPPADGSKPVSEGTTDSTETDKAVQKQRDNMFVETLFTSVAGVGVIISVLVWLSLPPRKKKASQ